MDKYEETVNYSALLLASVRDVQVALRAGFYGKSELLILTSVFNPQLENETKDLLLNLEQYKNKTIAEYRKQWTQYNGNRATVMMTPERKQAIFELQQQEVMQALKVIIKAMDKYGLLFTPSTTLAATLV